MLGFVSFWRKSQKKDKTLFLYLFITYSFILFHSYLFTLSLL